MPLDLSVIILNWNTRDLLAQSLRSLQRPQEGITFEVIVVDNASSDGSRDMLRADFPQIILHANPNNIGFGAGNNTGVPIAGGRYILFLNSDTVVEENALANIVQFGDANPDIGILGAKLLNEDGSLQYSCRRYPNLLTGFFRNTPLGKLLPQNRFASDYLMKSYDHETPRDVDWVSGAALMMRRTLYEQIGAFDDDYFMYCEDVDLCWRANHAPLPENLRKEADGSAIAKRISVFNVGQEEYKLPGTWRVAYFPDARIFHYIGKSSDKAPTRMTYEFHRSQYLFYKKHYRSFTPLLIRPLIPLGIALRAVGTMARYRINYYRRKYLKH